MKTKDEYRKTAASQHAPEEDRNIPPEKKGGLLENRAFLRFVAAAACLAFVITGAYAFNHRPGRVIYTNVSAVKNTEAPENSAVTGKNESNAENQANGLNHITVDNEKDLPPGILAGIPARQSGRNVYYGYDPDTGIRYATFKSGDGWELLYSAELGKTNFVREVRSALD